MTSAAQRKGDRAERELVYLLGLRRILVERSYGKGSQKERGSGDLDGMPGFVVEVKDYVDVVRSIREGLVEAEADRETSGERYGVALIRRPGGRWIAVFDLDNFARLVSRLWHLEGKLRHLEGQAGEG